MFEEGRIGDCRWVDRPRLVLLVKDHRYDYIETGSLISIRKNTKKIRIPERGDTD